MTEQTNNTHISKRRLWLFRIIIFLVVPVLLVLLLELGLFIAGYGHNTHAYAALDQADKHLITDNYTFSWRFFPPPIAREFDPFCFPQEKDNQTIRIFILGSSPAQGVPDGAYGFGRILEIMLKEAYPNLRFQVVNTAITAINSHVVREITRDSLQYKPDLFVVYMGNNEVVGPFGPGTVFSPASGNLWFIRLGMWFKTTRIGQLLSQITGGQGSGKEDLNQWRGLEMFLGNKVSPQDPRLKDVYSHFRDNITDIRDMAIRAGSGIVFCTVGVNLKDSPPFASMHRQDLSDQDKQKWQEFYNKGVAAEQAEQYQEALAYFLAAERIDDFFAALNFRMARCYQFLKQNDNAVKYYFRARQMDALRFRADETIGSIIRDVADNSGKPVKNVYLADAVEEFRLNSPLGVPGKELFYEHVHLNFHGNFILARSVFNQVKRHLQTKLDTAVLNSSPQTPPPETECARLLSYTPWNQYRTLDTVLNDYIKNPPYSNQLYHQQRVDELEQWLSAMREQLNERLLAASESSYQRSVEKYPEDSWLRRKYARFLHEVKGDLEAAEVQYRKVIDLLPHSVEGPAGLGYLLNHREKYQEAEKWNREALALHPYKADVWNNLALSLQKQGKTEEAISDYRKAMQIRPRYLPPYHNLGLFFKKQGKLEQSEHVFRDGLKMIPNSMELHYNLALLLNETKRKSEAIDLLRKALTIEPTSEPVRRLLDTIEAGKN